MKPKTALEQFFKMNFGCHAEILLATPRGFEPLISTVTGWHVRPLHHGAVVLVTLQVVLELMLSLSGGI